MFWNKVYIIWFTADFLSVLQSCPFQQKVFWAQRPAQSHQEMRQLSYRKAVQSTKKLKMETWQAYWHQLYNTQWQYTVWLQSGLTPIPVFLRRTLAFVYMAITKQSMINACGSALEAVSKAMPSHFNFNACLQWRINTIVICWWCEWKQLSA